MARQRRKLKQDFAPWRLLVLDGGGLTQLAANTEDARAALEISVRTGAVVVAPAIVLAESTRGAPSDATVNRALKGVDVIAVDEPLAREAALLKTRSGLVGAEHTTDAIVVAVATLAGGGAILTTDPKDVSALASGRPELRVRAIGV